jgi:hypothetical protein
MPSFTPTYDRTKVMAGLAAMYLAPYSAATPAVLPADTVALGGGWPTTPQLWVPIGASEEGVTMAFRRNTQDIMVEEQITPVSVETTDADLRFEVSLSEDVLENLRIAFGGGTVTTVAAATGVIGKKTLVLSTDLDHLALGFECKNPEGFFRRMLVPDVVSIADISTPFRRAANARRYRAAFRALVAPENVTIINKTANALP